MKPPHWSLAITEAPRAMADYSQLLLTKPLLRRKMPRGNGHGVVVIPGFMGSDDFNTPLVEFLNGLGYRASGWQQGRNVGPGSFSREDLESLLTTLAAAGDGKVSLIGHSLGGIYAREIARGSPQTIQQVITLGSPFGKGRRTGSNASRFYQAMNPGDGAEQGTDELAIPPPVPTTAIYTKGDGIVNWRTSVQDGEHRHVHNIEVIGSHIGLTINPLVWYWLAKKLAENHTHH